MSVLHSIAEDWDWVHNVPTEALFLAQEALSKAVVLLVSLVPRVLVVVQESWAVPEILTVLGMSWDLEILLVLETWAIPKLVKVLGISWVLEI